eukprot:5610227-Prymnesium_polylepis.1
MSAVRLAFKAVTQYRPPDRRHIARVDFIPFLRHVKWYRSPEGQWVKASADRHAGFDTGPITVARPSSAATTRPLSAVSS